MGWLVKFRKSFLGIIPNQQKVWVHNLQSIKLRPAFSALKIKYIFSPPVISDSEIVQCLFYLKLSLQYLNGQGFGLVGV